MGFNKGDKVLVGGNLVAHIVNYDEEADRLVFEHTPAGGGTDTVYGHISNTRLELIEAAPAVEAPVEDEEDADGDDD